MIKHLLVLLLLSVSGLTRVQAHDGHGERLVMSGTIKTVLSDRIELETFDQAMLQLKRVWVITDAKTKYVRAKKRIDVETAQPVPGERVVAVVSSEHTKDNSLRLVAEQIELKGLKKK
jgi:hypothetical protein